MNAIRSVASWTAAPWRLAARWLSNAPIDDPVDRRNAPMVQIVMIVLGVVPPLLWLYRILGSGLAWRPGETLSFVSSMALSAAAIAGLVLIRRGRFRLAVAQLLAIAVAAMLLAYARAGFSAQAYEQPAQIIWLVLGALVLGRRALWLMYAAHLAAFAIGVAVDMSRRSGTGYDAWSNQLVAAVITAVIFLLIAVVLDRSVTALRESLREANERGDELGRVNQRLEAEIAERERVREQLIHAQKVEAIGRLASGVAHDFNHLLNLMLGHAQRGRDSGDVVEMKDAMLGVETAARRAAEMVHTLLNFGRHDATRIETFDVRDALHEMRPMLLQLFESHARVTIEAPDASSPIAFDRAQFALVVLNIAANAHHAMPGGGRFAIRARNTGAGVEIEFADTGHGMSREVQMRIFEPFFTTKPRGQGTGLGLAVTASIVADAGGDIAVDSEPGRGTTLRIRLPLADAARGRAIESAAAG